MQAWNFSVGRKTSKSLLQVIVFSGREKTYQAWTGIPMAKYNNDTAGIDSLLKFLPYDPNSNYFSFDSLQGAKLKKFQVGHL